MVEAQVVYISLKKAGGHCGTLCCLVGPCSLPQIGICYGGQRETRYGFHSPPQVGDGRPWGGPENELGAPANDDISAFVRHGGDIRVRKSDVFCRSSRSGGEPARLYRSPPETKVEIILGSVLDASFSMADNQPGETLALWANSSMTGSSTSRKPNRSQSLAPEVSPPAPKCLDIVTTVITATSHRSVDMNFCTSSPDSLAFPTVLNLQEQFYSTQTAKL